MSTTASPPRLYTPDDLLAMNGDILYELVDGRLVEKDVSFISSRVGGRITQLLSNHCESPQIAHVLSEHGYACFPGRPNQVRKPDVSLVLDARMTPALFKEGFTSIPPDLVVEVVSPGDRAYDLREKLDDYRDAGVPLVWVVYPPSRSVEVLRGDGTRADLGPDDELTGEDVLPGFRCRVADLFAGLPAPPSPAT